MGLPLSPPAPRSGLKGGICYRDFHRDSGSDKSLFEHNRAGLATRSRALYGTASSGHGGACRLLPADPSNAHDLGGEWGRER
jgi:hypothetical protein